MLHLYDDAVARTFEPFALTRPGGELRAGAALVRERWTRALGRPATGFVSAAHLAEFEELDAPPASRGTLPAGAIVASTRCVVALDAAADAAADGAAVWTCRGRVAAVRLAEPLAVERLADGTLDLASLAPADAPRAEVAGWWLEAVWDLVGQLGEHLQADIPALARTLDLDERADLTVRGDHPVHLERGATVEPFVLFDTTDGPVLVRRGAVVHAFTRVVGPCYVGVDSTVMSDRVGGSAIGDVCRVHGEMSATILIGHANKAHDGFVGHSILGRWVNLGAGTTTSNLKNTYGTVAFWTVEGVRDTGLQFLGTLLGDHAKTGIQLPLNTGTVIGAGSMVYERMPPKHVPAFAWGSHAPYATYDVERFLRTAERAMARRKVPLGDGQRATLRRAHARALALQAAEVERRGGD